MIYSLDSVTKHYQSRNGVVCSLDRFSLDVRAGERLALIGRSGAGKTTLFRLLNATLRPTSGAVRFHGRDMSTMSWRELRQMRRQIGTIYQQHHLVPSLSALDNTLCGRLGHWSLFHTMRNMVRPSRGETAKALHALELVGLADKRGARADELSGGQQQRLAIARVLVQDPEVILADEPVASLDPGLAETIASLLVKLSGEGKRTLIVTLHSVELALRHFPRIVALHHGRVAFDLPASAVRRDTLDSLYTGDDSQMKEVNGRDANARREPQCAH